MYTFYIKKTLSLLLIFLIVGSTLCSCGEPQSESGGATTAKSSEIILTTKNLEEYFNVIPDAKLKENMSISLYFNTADVDLNIFAKRPLKAYDVVVTVKVKVLWEMAKHWDPQTVTLYLSYDGSASKHIEMSGLSYFDSPAPKDFSVEIVSVKGTVIPL